VRIVTKLLFPRLDETPSTELDDPLNEAAVNAMLASPSITDPSMVFKSEGDVEKGSIQVENKRQSSESKRPDPKKYRAVVRVEIHDTGVGLRKQDIIEYVMLRVVADRSVIACSRLMSRLKLGEGKEERGLV